LAQWLKHRQCRGCVSLSQVNPGLAEGEFVLLSQMRGCREMALVKQGKHLGGSILRYLIHKVMLTHGLIGLS
jgi:hypothetical protein